MDPITHRVRSSGLLHHADVQCVESNGKFNGLPPVEHSWVWLLSGDGRSCRIGWHRPSV